MLLTTLAASWGARRALRELHGADSMEVVLGPEFIAPRALAQWSDERKVWFGKAVLGTMLVGLALVFTGQIAITMIMEVDGYRACHVGGRGRYIDVTWARNDTECPPAQPGR